ncbi:acyl carrier protein [Bacteroidota bacterium]
MEIKNRLISIIMENTDHKYKITPDTNLFTELNIDSFGKLMIINAIEDEFSIEVDEDDIEKFATVNEIIEILSSKYI